MADNTRPKTATPWYLRIKTLVISAGALAVAILLVIALWNALQPPPQPPPPAGAKDEAVITDVRVVKPLMLFDFDSGQLGEKRTLDPDPDAAGSGPARLALTAEATATAVPSPTVEPTETVPPTVGPTETPTPTAPVEPDQEAIAREIAQNPRFKNSDIRSKDAALVRGPNVTSGPGSPNAGGQKGPVKPQVPDEEPTPEQVLDVLWDALSVVEGPNPESLNRQGWLVTVELDVAGKQGEEMMLTYALDPTAPGEGLPASWSAPHLGYYLTASTQQDTGVVDIWIPDLKAEIPYVVNVELFDVQDGRKIAVGQSVPIEEQ